MNLREYLTIQNRMIRDAFARDMPECHARVVYDDIDETIWVIVTTHNDYNPARLYSFSPSDDNETMYFHLCDDNVEPHCVVVKTTIEWQRANETCTFDQTIEDIIPVL